MLLLLFVIKEPKRGAVEARPEHHLHQTSWLTDLLALSKKYVQRHYRVHASCKQLLKYAESAVSRVQSKCRRSLRQQEELTAVLNQQRQKKICSFDLRHNQLEIIRMFSLADSLYIR